MVINQLKTACRLLLLFSIITGILYPFVITTCAQYFFPKNANGNLITFNNKIVGSEWVGQSFTADTFFHGRPSATPLFPYNPMRSSGSNIALTNPLLKKTAEEKIIQLQQSNPNNTSSIPMDLIASSASGLDPDISPAAALYQVKRVAKSNEIEEDVINTLVKKHTTNPYAGFIGEPRVNVLSLNLDLLSLRQSNKITKRIGNHHG